MTETDRKSSGCSLAHDKPISGSTEQVRILCGQLESGHPALFEQNPIDDYIALLDATPRGRHYHHVTPDIDALWRDILDEYGAEGLETYNRVTMLALIEAFDERAAGRSYPPGIVDEFKKNFARIVTKIDEAELGSMPHTDDIFLKDLAICRQRVFPVGSGLIADQYLGFSRSSLWTGGIVQFVRFLYLLVFVTRGNAPFYVTHIHLETVDEYTASARDTCDALIAEMLVRHREMKGWFASSWTRDPALKQISPRFAHKRRRAMENGAWSFRVGEDVDGGALLKSRTRRKLFEEGKYVPTAYLAVWPRKQMIAWARRRARELSVSGTD